MNILKRWYFRFKYRGLPKKFIFEAYTNLVCDPTDLSSEGNWKGYPDTKMVFEGESLTIGNHEKPKQVTFERQDFYDCELPANISITNEKELNAFLKQYEPVCTIKKNQQGKMITKYRIERYAKNSKMYIKELKDDAEKTKI